MSKTDTDYSRGRAWDAAGLLAMLAGLTYGLRNIPPAIEGIPFVQVLPAMVLGGLAYALVDLVGVVVSPRRREQQLVWLHLSALAIIVALLLMRPFVRARDRLREVIR
jgi:branched-subunit amino acid ABC-type transport system permease component